MKDSRIQMYAVIGRAHFDEVNPRRSPAAPTSVATIPQPSSQMVLFVGEPVKKRETPELNELLALMPRTINTIPSTRTPAKTSLFTSKDWLPETATRTVRRSRLTGG